MTCQTVKMLYDSVGSGLGADIVLIVMSVTYLYSSGIILIILMQFQII